MRSPTPHVAVVRWRFFLVCAGCFAMAAALVTRLVMIQVLPSQEKGFEFLQGQGDARTLRIEPINANRGVITDRNGEPLAISTPTLSICANPQELIEAKSRWPQLAQSLGLSLPQLSADIEKESSKEFMYLKRRLPPAEARSILALKVAGVFSQEEYRRYYPAGEVTAHIVGLTDVDDQGQEGIELAYNDWLRGSNGAKRVKIDVKRRIIEEMRLLKAAQPGNDLTLSIDLRLQYLAYRALKSAVVRHNAVSGSVVILDSSTGEVLAMVNQPSYNPNNRATIKPEQLINRAMVDQFEPGSTMKPITTLAALESKKFTPHTPVDTSPGRVRIPGKVVFDPVNYGLLDVTRVITKSSQVGITKIALELDPAAVRDMFMRLGIGQSIGTGFPGEGSGSLPSPAKWSPVTRATMAYGYGLSTTTLQLAQAYSVIANNGRKNTASLLKLDEQQRAQRSGEQVVDSRYARQILHMLETVMTPEGTGKHGILRSYTAAGKTGTAHKADSGAYRDEEKFSVFAGIAPAASPRIVVAIMINEPRAGLYSGGDVSAPVFAEIADQALRILQEPPDKNPHLTKTEIPAARAPLTAAQFERPQLNRREGSAQVAKHEEPWS